MITKEYNWINPGFAKGIDPEKAIEELKRIEQAYGGLTPNTLLEASRTRDSLFHKVFTWDDCVAAENWRLQQARTLLNNVQVTVINDGAEKQIPVYEVVKSNHGNVYKHINTFSKEDVLQVKGQCIKALNYWKIKLGLYKQYETLIAPLAELIEKMEGV